MLDVLNKEDRLQLMRFVCSFAWADLEIADAERDFIVKMVVRLKLDDEEQEQVRNGVAVPGLLSYLVHGSTDKAVTGLRDFPAQAIRLFPGGTIIDDDPRTGSRQRPADRPADAAGSAGNQGNFTAQIDIHD